MNPKPLFRTKDTWFFLLLLVIISSYLTLLLSIKSYYLPVNSDEYLYFINAKSFFLNSSLIAALTFTGTGSLLFGADAHGIGYPLFHGLIAKLAGWHNRNIIYTNFFLILGSLALYWRQSFLTIEQKIFISLLFLVFPFLPLFSVTFMQETLQVFIAVLASILLYKIYHSARPMPLILAFICTLFIAAFFRSLWLLWIIGLIPLARTKKQFLAYVSLFILSAYTAFTILYLFDEPVPSYMGSLIYQLEHLQIKSFSFSISKHFMANILYFLKYGYALSFPANFIYLSIKYSFLAIFLLYLYRLLMTPDNKLTQAVGLIVALNFILLLLLYDAFDWREIRSLAPVYYFILLFLVLDNRNFKLPLLAILVLPFFYSYSMSKDYIHQRNGLISQNYTEKKSSYAKIADVIERKNSTWILVNSLPADNTVDLLSLPLANKYGFPIHYIVKYYDLYNEKNKKADFLLSTPNQKYVNYKSVIKNNDYILWTYP